jgi:hypothetical protein
MAVAVDHLGIDYGENRSPNAPNSKPTGQWVKEQAFKLCKKEAALERAQKQLDEDRNRAEAEGYAVGQAKASNDHKAAITAAEALLNGEIPVGSLSKEARVIRAEFNKVRSAQEQENQMRRYGTSHSPTSSWMGAMEQYLFRVSDELWREVFARIRETHQRNMDRIDALSKSGPFRETDSISKWIGRP